MKILLVLFLVLLSASCQKKLDEDELDLGPEVNSNEILSAFADALPILDQSSYRLNEYRSLERNQRIENINTQKISDETKVIVEREFAENVITVKFLTRLDTYAVGKPVKVTESKQEIPISAVDSVNTLQKVNRNYFLNGFKPKSNREKYHRLQVSKDLLWDPPIGVMNSPDCKGLDPCQLNVTEIKFDLVIDGQHLHIEQGITKSIPQYVMSSIIYSCTSSLIPVDDRRVYVRECLVVRDFGVSSSLQSEIRSQE